MHACLHICIIYGYVCACMCGCVCVSLCVCLRERGGGKGRSIINRIIPVKSTKTFVLHHFGRHLYKQSPGTTWNRKGPTAPMQNQQTRELISAQKTSHLNTTKTWVTCGNSHLACKEIHTCNVYHVYKLHQRYIKGNSGICCCVYVWCLSSAN